MASLQLKLNQNLYIKDPQESELGRKIVQNAIEMIDEMGFEQFTIKKLSLQIGSTEATIYRYFENKHRLLIYLIAWYWNWIEYRISYETHNISLPEDRLSISLKILTQKKENDETFPDIDESALHRIVISESDKTYLTKQVDEDNKVGLFRGYKSLCRKIADMIKEINPDFRYAHALVSTVLEAAHQQIFFAKHLPSLTEISGSKEKYRDNFDFLHQMILKTIQA